MNKIDSSKLPAAIPYPATSAPVIDDIVSVTIVPRISDGAQSTSSDQRELISLSIYLVHPDPKAQVPEKPEEPFIEFNLSHEEQCYLEEFYEEDNFKDECRVARAEYEKKSREQNNWMATLGVIMIIAGSLYFYYYGDHTGVRFGIAGGVIFSLPKISDLCLDFWYRFHPHKIKEQS